MPTNNAPASPCGLVDYWITGLLHELRRGSIWTQVKLFCHPLSTPLEEVLHIVLVADHFKDQRVGGVFKQEPEFQADPNFEVVILKLAQANAFMQVRLAEAALSLGNSSANLPPFCTGKPRMCFNRLALMRTAFKQRRQDQICLQMKHTSPCSGAASFACESVPSPPA